MYVRKGNIKFVIVQDNIEKTLKIESIEKPKGETSPAFGYNEAELIGADFVKILTPETAELLGDYIEYNFSGVDLKEVCDKIIHFKMVDAEKTHFEVDTHIERAISMPERQVFMMLVEKRLYLRDRIKNIIAAQNDNEKIDEETGLMHRITYLNVLDEIMDFLNDNQAITSLIYTIRVDNFEEISGANYPDKTNMLVTGVAEAIKKGFRAGDIIAYLGQGVFSAILIRINPDEAQIPIGRFETRLRSAMLASSTGINFSVICNHENVDLEMETRALIEKCKKNKHAYEIKLV
jgi:GGDEF domain-containing protein